MNEGLRNIYQIEKKKPTSAQAFIEKIAKVACVDESTVRNWIGGRQKPSSQAVMEKVAQALGKKAKQLFND